MPQHRAVHLRQLLRGSVPVHAILTECEHLLRAGVPIGVRGDGADVPNLLAGGKLLLNVHFA
jgi:hypothetical protein